MSEDDVLAPPSTAAGGPRRRTVLATAAALPVVAAGGAGGAPAASAAPGPGQWSGRDAPPRLTVEHRVDPLGVDEPRPRFGWRMAAGDGRGRRQTAYRILVAGAPERLTRDGADVWDSGRVDSSESVAVRYDGPPLRPATRYFCAVLVWDESGRLTPDPPAGVFETGLMSTDGVTGWDGARWIAMAGKRPNTPGAPMLRRQVPLAGDARTVSRARLYVSALGVYDAYVNGRPVTVPHGDGRTRELLPPGWTNYDSAVSYLTYDVTDLVAGEPEVTLAAVLGNGWYNGRISEGSRYYAEPGHPPALKAKLLIQYADGTSQTVVTEPGAGWKATDAGPYRADDVYDGQTYDARREMPGWTANGFDDAGWSPVEEDDFADRFPDSRLVAYPGETARLVPAWDRVPRSITVATGVAGEADSPNGRGHIVVDESRSVTDPEQAATAEVTIAPGETAIFDLGQNIVGVPRYTVRGPAGAEVAFRFAEMLNDDSEGADGPEGSAYRANLRSAKATSTYVLRGEPGGETHQDALSFYGFRYVAATVTAPAAADADASVTISGLTGRVATSALHDTGTVETDDPLVNRLIDNVRWGQRGNYLWVPTDCPQRDERLGWSGDTQVFAATGLYNSVDAVTFLAHFQDTLIASQRTYGVDGAQFPCVAPGARFLTQEGTSGWSDCGVIVPWTVWQMSGDPTIIDRSWPAMTSYLDWIRERTGDTYAGQGALFGDWLAPQPSGTRLLSDVYYAYSARLMADMARATGRDAEARRYEELFGHIRRAFMDTYLATDPDTGRVTVRSGLGQPPPEPGGDPDAKAEDDSQTALLWVLKLGLYDTEAQRRQLVELLAANIRNDEEYQQAHPGSSRLDYAQNTLAVGFLGVNVLAPVLTAEGRADLAYTLLHQDALPSWLFSVRNGATTIWERWNSYSQADGFGPVDMNSFNHYAYGAILEWLYESVAGIARDPAHPGFRHFFLRPHLDPTGRITRVAGSHLSPYGTIVSEWAVRGSTLHYRAVVPPNSSATLRIPAAGPDAVREGGTPLSRAPGARYEGFSEGVSEGFVGGAASFRLASGDYRLTSALR